MSTPMLRAFAMTAALTFLACADGPTDPAELGGDGLPLGFSISEAVGDSGGARSVAYTSAEPGTFPGGVTVEITNLTTGETITIGIADGGYDPVPIPAEPDDELEIVVRDADGSTITLLVRVPLRKRPRVVRTRPPKGATDVVLTGSLQIVFSEPVDRTSITSGAIMLRRGSDPVPGTLSLQLDGVYVQFTALEPLERNTSYTLVVTTGILDRDGDALVEPVDVSFTTEDAPPSQLVFTSEPRKVQGNQVIASAVEVTVQNRYGFTTTDWSEPVTVQLFDRPGSGRLTGTTTVTPVGGVARFDDLKIDQPGSGYVLLAITEGLPGRTSAAFDVTIDFVAIAAGAFHTCGLTRTADVYCWGYNGSGRLGDGTTSDRNRPTLVSAGQRYASLTAGRHHTCAITITGSAFCWGENFRGQLGDGTVTARATPTPVLGGRQFTSLGAHDLHTCGLTTDGEIYCWGENVFGQLGDGTTTASSAPVRVDSDLTFATVAVGGSSTCAVTDLGEAYCWGANAWGQLGDGTTSSSPTPRLVSGSIQFARIAMAYNRSCGLSAGGAAYCWGFNRGNLGDGTMTDRSVPAAVVGGHRFVTLSAAGATCGVTDLAELYCWGANGLGQNGDGTTTPAAVPVRVQSSLTFANVGAGGGHTCALTNDGAYCWGGNDDGQLGNGTTNASLLPSRVVQ